MALVDYFPILKDRVRRRQFNSLFLFVTSRCNSLCRTCFYFDKLNSRDDLTTAEIARISETAPPVPQALALRRRAVPARRAGGDRRRCSCVATACATSTCRPTDCCPKDLSGHGPHARTVSRDLHRPELLARRPASGRTTRSAACRITSQHARRDGRGSAAVSRHPSAAPQRPDRDHARELRRSRSSLRSTCGTTPRSTASISKSCAARPPTRP